MESFILNKKIVPKKAFTLLELVIVVIIIAVLAALGIPQFTKVLERSRWTEAVTNLGAIRKACFMYYAQYGAYPGYTWILNGPRKDAGADLLDVNIEDPDADGRYIYRLYGQNYSTNLNAAVAYACHDSKVADGVWGGGEPYIRIYYDGHYFSSDAPGFSN